MKAIGEGQIDATVSQPADLYAKYALFYIKAAIAGQKFARQDRPRLDDRRSRGRACWRTSFPRRSSPRTARIRDSLKATDPQLWGNQIK